MKKGFTLVELLGVIVLLATIILIVTASVLNAVKSTNSTLDESTKKVLYTAAETYLNDNVILSSNGDYTVTVGVLVQSNLISSNFLDTQSDSGMTNDSCVKVNITNGVMNYDFSYTCE